MRCWAFHAEHGRCDMDAGHDGMHSVERRWSDEECIDPTVTRTRERTVLTYTVQACVACGHQHPDRDGEPQPCKCGCYAHI